MRIVIDQLLRQAQWNPADKSGGLKSLCKIWREEGIGAGLVLQWQPAPRELIGGREGGAAPRSMDYVLFTQNGRPLAVSESKKACL